MISRFFDSVMSFTALNAMISPVSALRVRLTLNLVHMALPSSVRMTKSRTIERVPELYAVISVSRVNSLMQSFLSRFLGMMGYCGGYGVCATIGNAFKSLGQNYWEVAQGIGMTFSTIGMIGGILIGIAVINIKARKKETHYLADPNSIPKEMKLGVISDPNEQPSAGKQTTSGGSIDTIALHLALIMQADALPELDDMTLLILQAGALHTGAFDEIRPICEKACRAGAWIHIDGAIGLWAAASENLKHLTDGLELADSWAADAHKGLNAPYDNGIVLCRDRGALKKAMGGADLSGIDASAGTSRRDNMDYTFEMSRRARSVELWAVIKSLGRGGIGQMQDELHAKAVYFARRLADAGFEIMSDCPFIVI